MLDLFTEVFSSDSRDLLFILGLSPDGDLLNIEQVNDTAVRQSEYSRADLLGMKLTDLLEGLDANDLDKKLKRSTDFPLVITNHQLITRSGAKKSVEILLCPLKTSNLVIAIGRDSGMPAYLDDDSPARDHFYEEILENVQDGIWVTDSNDVIVYTNRGMETIAGISRDRIIGSCLTCDFDSSTVAEFNTFYRRARQSRETIWYEVPVTTPVGRATWQNGWLVPRYKGDIFLGMICTIRDITQRKMFESALHREKELAIQFFTVAGVMLIELGIDRRVKRINPKGCEILGYDQDEVIGKDWFETFLQVDDLNSVLSVFNEIISGNLSQWEYFENAVIRKDGSVRNIAWHNSALRDADGKVTGLFSSGEDITDRLSYKRLEKETLQRLQLAMESANEGIWEWDCRAGLITFDDNARRMLQLPDNIPSQNLTWWRQLIHSDDRKRVFDKFESFITGNCEYMEQHRLLRSSDDYIWVTSNARVVRFSEDNKPELVVGIFRDITDRKQAEIALQRSKNRFDLAMEATSDGLYDWNMITNEIYFSPGWKRMLGYEDHELPNQFSVWQDLTDPEGVKAALDHLQDHVDGKVDRFEIEFKMHHKQGHWIDVLSRATAFVDADGKPYRVVGTHQDITQRKKLQQQLKTVHHALENSLNGFDIVDENLKLIYVNKAYVSMWGYDSPEEVIGTSPIQHCVDPDIPQKIMTMVEKDGKCVIEFKAKRKDGSQFDVLMYVRKDFDESGRIIYPSSSVDISQRKQAEREKEHLEEQLRQTQKMEAVATLAGGIAHDFNNMLAVIVGNTSLVLEEMDEACDLSLNLKDVLNAAEQARGLTQQLLTYARGGEPVKSIASINACLQEAVELVIRGTQSTCSFHLDQDLKPVEIDIDQMKQAISNIIINACQAMTDGGQVAVTTANVDLSTNTVAGLPGGRYVCITISDQGSGIGSDDISKIFDPFFTTKPQGSGLGLTTSYSIVRKHKGYITAKSVQGERLCLLSR